MVVKEKLAALCMCYSITVMEYHGREYCISASEERDGGIVMIDTETKAVSELEGLAGGVMWVIGVIEGILYLTKSQSEFEQTYVVNKREWF